MSTTFFHHWSNYRSLFQCCISQGKGWCRQSEVTPFNPLMSFFTIFVVQEVALASFLSSGIFTKVPWPWIAASCSVRGIEVGNYLCFAMSCHSFFQYKFWVIVMPSNNIREPLIYYILAVTWQLFKKQLTVQKKYMFSYNTQKPLFCFVFVFVFVSTV